MLKTKLLTTASAVVVACGAITLGSTTAAQAGELKIKMTDVNLQCYESPSDTVHIDWDCYEYDANGSTSPGAPTGDRSIDKGFIGVYKPEFNQYFYHVAVADERSITPETPASGLYEVDLFEIDGASTLTPTVLIEIELSGSANPMFKETTNCADAMRAGSDGIFSKSASGPISDPDHGIQEGKMRAVCLVNPQLDKQYLDSAIGFALPINSKACGDLVITYHVTRISDGFNQGTETVSHLFQECRDSIHSASGYDPVKIDYYADFRSFLIDPDPYNENYEEHVASLWAHTGALDFDLWHNLTDLKEPKTNKNSEEHVFDASDIDGYWLTVSFADLTGIESFVLDNNDGSAVPAILDRELNTASWHFTGAEFAEQFCLEPWTYDGQGKGGLSDGCTNWFTIHAFGPHSDDYYNGPIDHQEGVITQSLISLTSGEYNATHPVPFQESEVEQLGAIVAHLKKTGIVFGPFDWVGDADDLVKSVFRVTGIPVDKIDDLKGSIIVENSSEGDAFNGEYKVDYDDSLIVGNEIILNSPRIRDLFDAAGMPNQAEWGRADLTFTFYVPGHEGIKMDMDRLMRSGDGTYASYGDNSNDAFSLKARSCDDGRFGPHVANKLDPEFKYLLVGICNLGELSRYGLYYQP